ncbi:MAG: isoamylase early set domain-containing protein [Bacteroidota bacterium]
MINKKYSPKGKSCKVTFELPADAAAESVAVLGEFNNWDPAANTLALKKKKGVWTTTVSLKPGNEYAFRYLADGNEWSNDEDADRVEANTYGTTNSVIAL